MGCAPLSQVLKVIHLGFFSQGEKPGVQLPRMQTTERGRKLCQFSTGDSRDDSICFQRIKCLSALIVEGCVQLNNSFISSEITIAWHLDTGKIFWNSDVLQNTAQVLQENLVQ